MLERLARPAPRGQATPGSRGTDARVTAAVPGTGAVGGSPAADPVRALRRTDGGLPDGTAWHRTEVPRRGGKAAISSSTTEQERVW